MKESGSSVSCGVADAGRAKKALPARMSRIFPAIGAKVFECMFSRLWFEVLRRKTETPVFWLFILDESVVLRGFGLNFYPEFSGITIRNRFDPFEKGPFGERAGERIVRRNDEPRDRTVVTVEKRDDGRLFIRRCPGVTRLYEVAGSDVQRDVLPIKVRG